MWLIDACIAPLGLLVADAMRVEHAAVLLVLPLNLALLLVSRDRNARIEQAQTRLDLVAHERSRLQTAVRRLGEALAAKLDLDALTDIVLRGSIEALDADAGRLTLGGAIEPSAIEIDCTPERRDALEDALELALREADRLPARSAGTRGRWRCRSASRRGSGGRAARSPSPARAAPSATTRRRSCAASSSRAQDAAADIVAHQQLREQALTDPLTGLGNRRRLRADADEPRSTARRVAGPLVLMLFDLDGFKSYNDTFGHPAGDAMLARLGSAPGRQRSQDTAAPTVSAAMSSACCSPPRRRTSAR